MVTLNVQSAVLYGGIAEISSKLPPVVIDRYLVAKDLSRKEGRECYAAVKEYWKCFINRIKSQGYHRLDSEAMEHILNERVRLFPLFLAERSIKDEVDIG